MFKPWSPMSVGSWAVLAFGAFAFVGFLAALAESGRLRWSWLTALRPPRPLGVVVGVLGGLLAFFVAGYTGVLLAVTNRPIWSDSPLLGLLFVVSAASTSAALLLLLGRTRRIGVPGLEALERFGGWVMVLELLVLIAFVVSLGRVASVWLSGWGVLLLPSGRGCPAGSWRGGDERSHGGRVSRAPGRGLCRAPGRARRLRRPDPAAQA